MFFVNLLPSSQLTAGNVEQTPLSLNNSTKLVTNFVNSAQDNLRWHAIALFVNICFLCLDINQSYATYYHGPNVSWAFAMLPPIQEVTDLWSNWTEKKKAIQGRPKAGHRRKR